MTSLFLSYAWGDDDPFVKRLYEDLTGRGFDVWWDRVNMPSRDLSFFREIEEAIAARDRLILILGPQAIASDYVAAEWQFALDSGKPVNPVLRLGDYDTIPSELHFVHAPDFRDDAVYANALNELVRQIAEPPAPLGKLVGVPDLPSHFVRHRDRTVALKECIIADFARKTIITGVHGMGGIGKSVLANALARDFQIRRHFPDGIFWITVGQGRDPASLQAQLAGALGDEQHFATVEQGRRRLREMLSEKAALLVLDDVWAQEQAEAFDVLGPRCRTLITTRDASLLTSLAGVDYEVQLLSDGEAKHLLAEWTGCPEADLPALAAEVIEECGRLPLAISICGAMVRDGTPWEDVVAALREADLQFLDHRLRSYPHTSVFRSIKVSVDALEPEARQRFVELCAFHHDALIPEGAIETLWNHTGGLTGRHARELLTRLERRSLIRLDSDRGKPNAPQTRVAFLHDLIYDHVCSLAENARTFQEALLAAYRERCPEGWHTGPNDGYFFQHLCRHLTELDHREELEATLTDLRFIEAKCTAGMTYDLVRDYTKALASLPESQLEQEKHWQREQLVRDYTERLIAYSKGERRNLDTVQSIPPLSREELAKEANRARAQPTRFDRMQAFSQFVSSESHTFAGYARTLRFCLQQAWNWSGPGPVTNAAERIVRCNTTDTMLLRKLPKGPDYTPYPALVRTLEGHVEQAHSVDITPDGRLAISSGRDGTVRVWDVETGVCRHALKDNFRESYCVTMTPDGKMGVCGDRGGRLHIFDLEAGECMFRLSGHESDVFAVSITPDGRRAVSSDSKAIRVWDLCARACIFSTSEHKDIVTAVATTADGQTVVSASHDRTVRVWDLENGRCLETLSGHSSGIRSVAITPDGKRAVSGSLDHTARVWDLDEGRCLRTLQGHTSWVNGVSITPDAKMVVTGSKDNTLRVWSVDTGECLRVLEGHLWDVLDVALRADGTVAVSSSYDGTLGIWDLERGVCVGLDPSVWWVDRLDITPDGRRAVSAMWEGRVRIWDLCGQTRPQTLGGVMSSSGTVEVLPDSRRAISATDGSGNDVGLRLWELDAGKCLRFMQGKRGAEYIAVSADGHRAVSGDRHGEHLEVWDLLTGHCVQTLEQDGCFALSMLPDGAAVVSGSADRWLRVWDLRNGKCSARIEEDGDYIRHISIGPDGKTTICRSGWQLQWKVYDLEQGVCLGTLDGEALGGQVQITPDGRRAVCGTGQRGSDPRLSVWDLRGGKCLLILEGHTREVSDLTISPDGHTVISAGYDKTVRVWDIETGECLAIYPAETIVTCLSRMTASGHIGFGTSDGEGFLFCRNLTLAPPVVTAIRLWSFATDQQKGSWSSDITAMCAWCGQRFTVDGSILDVIVSVCHDRGLPGHGPLSLSLPGEAWSEPHLLSECPECGHSIRFNPFAVDRRAREWNRC